MIESTYLWVLLGLLVLLYGSIVSADDELYPDIQNRRTNALPAHYCHNMCSGHGRCQNDDVCYCASEYNTSLVPDCSWRVCPYGAAWVDKAYNVDSAHSQKECSGAGSCNRYTGICECFDGYTGKACERMDCPKKCSGHGECYTMATLQYLYNLSHTSNDVYGLWDANKVMGCACDLGYTGGACDMKMCPKGHDPLIEQDATHGIVLQTYSESGALSGNFKLSFMGKSFEFNSVVAAFYPSLCKKKFESLPGIRSVTCSHSAPDYAHGGTRYYVNFTGWPTNPQENNIFSHNGRPVSDFFHCDVSNVTNAAGNQVHCNIFTGDLGDRAVSVIRYDYCSNRGICNLDKGECSCYQNFYGAACELYVPHALYEDYIDVMTISANDTDFTDTVLRIQDTIRGDAGDWSSFYIETNEETYNTARTAMFNITSDGDVIHSRGGWELTGRRDGLTGVTIHKGGLQVSDGITIESEGLEIVNKGVAGDVTFHGAGNILAGLSFDDTLNIGKPGLTITGGLTIQDDGLIVPDCLTPIQGRENTFGVACLRPKGIFVGAGGADFHHGAAVTSGMNITGGLRMGEWRTDGVTVETGGLDVFGGGLTVWYKGLVIDRQSRFEDGLTVTGGVTVTNGFGVAAVGDLSIKGGIEVSNKAYVRAGGASVSGSLHVFSGGINTYSDKLDILQGGLRVNAPTSGVSIREGLTLANDPTSPTSDGLRVTLEGLTVVQGAVVVTGGVTIASGGLKSLNEAAVDITDGLAVTGGISHSDHGDIFAASRFVVTGGMTVIDTGVKVVSGGITVTSDGMSVSEAGVNVAVTEGVRIEAGGLTVASSGLKVSQGTVTNLGAEGIAVDGGVKVESGGAVFSDIGADHYFDVYGTVSVTAGGLLVGGKGLNISEGGITIQDSGVSINFPIASVQDAYDPKTTTIDSIDSANVINVKNGITATGGISVQSLGLFLNSDVELEAGGWGRWHQVHGGLSIFSWLNITAGGLGVGGQNGVTPRDVTIKNGTEVAGGVTVRGNGGLSIEAGGLSIQSGGLRIYTNNNDQADTIHNTGTYWRGGISLGGKLTTEGGLRFRSGSRSDIEDDGGVILKGGMTVESGGVDVDSAEFSILPWASVHSGQEHEQRDPYAIDVTGGVTVGDTGLHITNPRGPDAFRTDDIPIWHKPGIKYGLHLSDPDNNFGATSGLYVNAGGVNVDAHGISVESDGVTVYTAGMVVTSPVAVTIMDEGLSVRSGGLTSAGNFKVSGGASVMSEGMEVTGGLSIEEGGLVITDGNLANSDTSGVGAKINIAGLVVSENSAVDVDAGGIDITTGGLLVNNGGVTIRDIGIATLKGGITVSNTGVNVSTGGVTVTAGGLTVTGKAGTGDAKEGLKLTAGNLVSAHDFRLIQHTLYAAASSVSDRRLKTNLDYMEPHESLQKLRLLHGVYFHWNNDTSHATSLIERRLGLIAQDVHAVLPEAVQLVPFLDATSAEHEHDSDNDRDNKNAKEGNYLGVRYDGVLPLLVEALRALSEKIIHLSNSTSTMASRMSVSNGTTQKSLLLASIKELNASLAAQEYNIGALESLAMK